MGNITYKMYKIILNLDFCSNQDSVEKARKKTDELDVPFKEVKFLF